MPFIPHKWFADLAAADGGGGGGVDGLGADGLPRQGSSFWRGVPPARLGGGGGGGGSRDEDSTVYRRFVNGPHRFVWLVTMYDEASDTAYGRYNLNCGEGGRWGPIPMAHVRMLGGRVDASWRPLPYADAVLHRARVSAPYFAVRRLPPHSLVGFDACPSPSEEDDDDCGSGSRRGARGIRRTIEIPRRARPCGIDSETGAPMYEYCYGAVPQDGAPVVVNVVYQSGDAGALALARRLNGSHAYAIRVCRGDGDGCALCWERPCTDNTQRRTAGRAAAAAAAATAEQAPHNGGGGRQ